MLTCPHCQSTKINKNGKKPTGIQNFLCRTCKKQFQLAYKKNGANPVIKKLVIKALCRNSGITDIENIFEGGCHQLSKPYILHTLVSYAENLDIKPQKQHYESLQIDEFWTYVGSKNNKKWLL